MGSAATTTGGEPVTNAQARGGARGTGADAASNAAALRENFNQRLVFRGTYTAELWLVHRKPEGGA